MKNTKASRATDSIQAHLTNYASELQYGGLSPESIRAAKGRIIDTLGALIAGFSGEPCQIARSLAARYACSEGSTILGTRVRTVPDMAAFVNATTSRYPELTDTNHWPGSWGGHPSDMI